MAEETDGAGATLVRYACATSGAAIAQQSYRVIGGHADPTDTEGTWRWLLPDADANVATQLGDDGSVAEQSAFDPYGKPQAGGSSITDPKAKGSTLGFQGAITDRATGSVVLGPRLYDPSTARFSTADSFVSGGLDLGLALDPSPATATSSLGPTRLPTSTMGTRPTFARCLVTRPFLLRSVELSSVSCSTGSRSSRRAGCCETSRRGAASLPGPGFKHAFKEAPRARQPSSPSKLPTGALWASA